MIVEAWHVSPERRLLY